MARVGMIGVCVSALAVGCGVGSGSRTADGSEAGAVEVFDAAGTSLGSVAFPVSCSGPAAENMRLGLALLHNMTYDVAEAAFAAAADQDQDCVLAYWGMAMSLFHPLWPDLPSDEVLEHGLELVQEAWDRGAQTEREEAYIAALERYYSDGVARDEVSRLESYAAGWEEVHLSYPDDPEAALFYALALTAAAPGSDLSFASQREAGGIAEAVMARIPDHPGAHHYVIHAYDSPPLAERALPAARRYGEVSSGNGHALHMTSHIFTRLGLWEESVHYNERSWRAVFDEQVQGGVSHNHLHAVDYLVYAHLQRGNDQQAREILVHLESLVGPIYNHTASAYAFAAVPSRIALETQDWAHAADIEARWPATIPWDEYPFLEAIPVFAGALGAAHTGELEEARRALARLSTLREQAGAIPMAYDWESQVRVQELAAEAWIAHAEGRESDALRIMQESAEVEASVEKSPVTPGEVLPARELLGDMLLEMGRPAEALAAYEAALRRSPNRFNSLYGAGRAAELSGDRTAAEDYYHQLVETSGFQTPVRERLQHAEAFLGVR